MEVIGNHILLNIFFCVQQKKETHTGLKQLEDEEIMTESLMIHAQIELIPLFLVNCSFKKND